MAEEKKLYPMQMCSIEDKFAWGTETYGIADLGYRDSLIRGGWLAANSLSEVMETYLDRVVGENVYDIYGRQFPVQVKLISVDGKMPLRVHPSDELASDRYDALGKEKFWYVLNAQAGSKLCLGFAKGTNPSEVLLGCEGGSIENSLYSFQPKAGDSFHIAPGTVHCAMGKMTIVEISQSSAMDFCLTAWGQPLAEDEFDSELNVVEALDFIDYSAYRGNDLAIDQFAVRKIDLAEPARVITDQYDSFLLYHCLYGQASVTIEEEGLEMKYSIRPGDTLLVPAEVEDFLLSSEAQHTALLEVNIPKKDMKDAYINPDVPDKLPGEEDE